MIWWFIFNNFFDYFDVIDSMDDLIFSEILPLNSYNEIDLWADTVD